MSDHQEPSDSDESGDDIKSNRTGRPRRMSPPPLPLRGSGEQPNADKAPQWEKLKPKAGYGPRERNFFREAIKIELPPPPQVQQEIAQQLIIIEELPPPDDRKRQSPPPERRLRRDQRRNLAQDVSDAWKMSRDEVLALWKTASDSFAEAKAQKASDLAPQGLRELIRDLSDKAQATIDAGERFLAVGKSDKPRGGRGPRTRSELTDRQEEIVPVVAEARRMLQAIIDLTDETDPGPNDLGLALHAKQLGIRFSDLKLDEYSDDKVDPQKSKEDFAGGAVNKVSKLAYGDETRIFKAEALTTNSKANLIGILGIDKSAPRFGNRNIATKAMADVLDSKVIPDSCFAVHNGKIGLLMEVANGQEMKDFKKTGFDPSPPSAELVASLQSQLNELEWTDMLTGQGDRHDGNYMIETKDGGVKITGIDNDFCFGKEQSDYAEYGSDPKAGQHRGGRRGDYWGYNSAELPSLIDSKAFQKLDKADFDRDVRPKLAKLLTQEEVAASAARFAQMQAHARSLAPDFVVENWADWLAPENEDGKRLTATEFLKANKAISLFQRDFGKLV